MLLSHNPASRGAACTPVDPHGSNDLLMGGQDLDMTVPTHCGSYPQLMETAEDEIHSVVMEINSAAGRG